ncbi:unnamed protein product [Oncorhynchus mykiss]|uniref:T-cell immunomodulatory protein n=1 Tax=Oncorhynchus mykiss TaxID=8022 RepID=A0A060VMB3_ONCMY|nr:unnamed protein product [Oncorhynchus mykiss]
MRMWILFINIFTFTVYFAGKYSASALQDVTTDLFGSENHGTVAAFGDFNSDKQTDIFIIREQSELVIFLADLKAPYFKPKVHITKKDLPVNCIITSVVPGDYDGDSQMDVLLTVQLKTKATSDTMVVVFWGNNQTLDEQVDLNKTFVDQPLIMDFNGDMIPDIFGVSADFSTEVCYLTGRNAVWQPALSSPVKIRIPHSNAFIDINKDFTAAFPRRQGSLLVWARHSCQAPASVTCAPGLRSLLLCRPRQQTTTKTRTDALVDSLKMNMRNRQRAVIQTD